MKLLDISSAKVGLSAVIRGLERHALDPVQIRHGKVHAAAPVYVLSSVVFNRLLVDRGRPRLHCTLTLDETAPSGWWTIEDAVLEVYGDGAGISPALASLVQALLQRASDVETDLLAERAVPDHALLRALWVYANTQEPFPANREKVDPPEALLIQRCKECIDPQVTVITQEGEHEEPLDELGQLLTAR